MTLGVVTKVLIAIRGEISLRAQRACEKLGIGCTAVFTEPDALSLHVLQAPESVCLGASPKEYLNAEKLIEVAKSTGEQAGSGLELFGAGSGMLAAVGGACSAGGTRRLECLTATPTSTLPPTHHSHPHIHHSHPPCLQAATPSSRATASCLRTQTSQPSARTMALLSSAPPQASQTKPRAGQAAVHRKR